MSKELQLHEQRHGFQSQYIHVSRCTKPRYHWLGFLCQLHIFTVGDTGQDGFFVTPWDVWNHPSSHCDDVICSDMQSMLHFELDLTSRAIITDLDYVSCKTRWLKWDFSECSFQPSGIGLILSYNLALGIHILLCLTDILQSSLNPLDLLESLRIGFWWMVLMSEHSPTHYCDIWIIRERKIEAHIFEPVKCHLNPTGYLYNNVVWQENSSIILLVSAMFGPIRLMFRMHILNHNCPQQKLKINVCT